MLWLFMQPWSEILSPGQPLPASPGGYSSGSCKLVTSMALIWPSFHWCHALVRNLSCCFEGFFCVCVCVCILIYAWKIPLSNSSRPPWILENAVKDCTYFWDFLVSMTTSCPAVKQLRALALHFSSAHLKLWLWALSKYISQGRWLAGGYIK